jgi:hypothetical protein
VSCDKVTSREKASSALQWGWLSQNAFGLFDHGAAGQYFLQFSVVYGEELLRCPVAGQYGPEGSEGVQVPDRHVLVEAEAAMVA